MEQMMEYVPNMYATFWALVPPLVAIILALVTKEVYSSLFIGIVIGGLFYGNIFQQGFSFEKSVLHIFEDGLVGVLSDPYNVGILIFLVVLGIMVSMMNKAGGSAAFGQWAGRHIKTRIGAQLSAVLLGMLIFIDDYFNCLTVGSVMRPVTDKLQETAQLRPALQQQQSPMYRPEITLFQQCCGSHWVRLHWQVLAILP